MTTAAIGRRKLHFLSLLVSIICATLMLGTHYPCSWAVFTGREHGPWTRASFLDTREHGPLRSAGAIVNGVIVIFLLAGRMSKMTPVFTGREWWTRPVHMGSVYRPLTTFQVVFSCVDASEAEDASVYTVTVTNYFHIISTWEAFIIARSLSTKIVIIWTFLKTKLWP